jgi:hypothetical protein
MTQPSMFSDSMLLSEAEARLARLAPLLEGPDQQALEVALGAMRDRGQILEVVRKMRAAQRDYFRSKADLGRCKALESRVDGLLKE